MTGLLSTITSVTGSFSWAAAGFTFRVKPRFPKSLTREFLLVDLVYNLDQLAEAKEEVLKRVAERAAEVDQKRLRRAVRDYGSAQTKKFFERALPRDSSSLVSPKGSRDTKVAEAVPG
jgi:hypothetical protein